jgi:hypothetical protein
MCWTRPSDIRLSEVFVSDTLKSDHAPLVFKILDYGKYKNHMTLAEEFGDWVRFQSLASDLATSRIEIISKGSR